jgi:hypothetical protein
MRRFILLALSCCVGFFIVACAVDAPTAPTEDVVSANEEMGTGGTPP